MRLKWGRGEGKRKTKNEETRVKCVSNSRQTSTPPPVLHVQRRPQSARSNVLGRPKIFHLAQRTLWLVGTTYGGTNSGSGGPAARRAYASKHRDYTPILSAESRTDRVRHLMLDHFCLSDFCKILFEHDFADFVRDKLEIK